MQGKYKRESKICNVVKREKWRDTNKLNFKNYLVQRQEETKVLQTSSPCSLLEVEKKELGFINQVQNEIAI